MLGGCSCGDGAGPDGSGDDGSELESPGGQFVERGDCVPSALFRQANAGAVWVSPTGSDSGEGTAEDPLRSFEIGALRARNSPRQTLALADGRHEFGTFTFDESFWGVSVLGRCPQAVSLESTQLERSWALRVTTGELTLGGFSLVGGALAALRVEPPSEAELPVESAVRLDQLRISSECAGLDLVGESGSEVRAHLTRTVVSSTGSADGFCPGVRVHAPATVTGGALTIVNAAQWGFMGIGAEGGDGGVVDLDHLRVDGAAQFGALFDFWGFDYHFGQLEVTNVPALGDDIGSALNVFGGATVSADHIRVADVESSGLRVGADSSVSAETIEIHGVAEPAREDGTAAGLVVEDGGQVFLGSAAVVDDVQGVGVMVADGGKLEGGSLAVSATRSSRTLSRGVLVQNATLISSAVSILDVDDRGLEVRDTGEATIGKLSVASVGRSASSGCSAAGVQVWEASADIGYLSVEEIAGLGVAVTESDVQLGTVEVAEVVGDQRRDGASCMNPEPLEPWRVQDFMGVGVNIDDSSVSVDTLTVKDVVGIGLGVNDPSSSVDVNSLQVERILSVSIVEPAVASWNGRFGVGVQVLDGALTVGSGEIREVEGAGVSAWGDSLGPCSVILDDLEIEQIWSPPRAAALGVGVVATDGASVCAIDLSTSMTDSIGAWVAGGGHLECHGCDFLDAALAGIMVCSGVAEVTNSTVLGTTPSSAEGCGAGLVTTVADSYLTFSGSVDQMAGPGAWLQQGEVSLADVDLRVDEAGWAASEGVVSGALLDLSDVAFDVPGEADVALFGGRLCGEATDGVVPAAGFALGSYCPTTSGTGVAFDYPLGGACACPLELTEVPVESPPTE